MADVKASLGLNDIWKGAQSGYNSGSLGFTKKAAWAEKWWEKNSKQIGQVDPRYLKSFNNMPNQVAERFMKSKMGPQVAAVGMGIGALGQLGNMRQRMRYHDYGGAALSGGMAAAMGYGAYMMGFQKEAMSGHLKRAAMMAGKQAYGIRGASRAIGQMMKMR